MRSKLIIYGVVAIVVIIAGFLVWHFLFSGSGGAAVTPPPGTTGSLPSVGTQTGSGNGSSTTSSGPSSGASTGLPTGAVKFGVISDEPVLDYFVDASNNVTVVEPDGKIATIVSGQPNFLSSTEIQGVLAASFSYDGKKVLVNFGDPADPQTSVFDVATKAWMPLPAGLVSPAWSQSDYRIAYLTTAANGVATLSTLDVSKASNKPVALLSLNAADLSLVWPNKNDVVLSGKPSAYASASAWIFDLAKKTLTQAVPESFGMESAWSATTGTVGLVLSSPTYGMSGALSLVDPAATSTQALTLATLPTKCAFNYEAAPAASSSPASASSSAATPFLALYCAVPSDASFGTAILPDAYNQMAIFTSDNFYEINTATGATNSIFSPSGAIDAEDLRVANNILFFVNRYDSKLYAISL